MITKEYWNLLYDFIEKIQDEAHTSDEFILGANILNYINNEMLKLEKEGLVQ